MLQNRRVRSQGRSDSAGVQNTSITVFRVAGRTLLLRSFIHSMSNRFRLFFFFNRFHIAFGHVLAANSLDPTLSHGNQQVAVLRSWRKTRLETKRYCNRNALYNTTIRLGIHGPGRCQTVVLHSERNDESSSLQYVYSIYSIYRFTEPKYTCRALRYRWQILFCTPFIFEFYKHSQKA